MAKVMAKNLFPKYLWVFLLALVVLSIFPITASAEFILKKWAYQKTLAPKDNNTDSAYGEFVLDKEIFNHASPGLEDLRIIDASGREIPYFLQVAGAPQADDKLPARILENTTKPGAETVIIVDAGEDKPLYNGLNLTIEDKEFLREVIVEVSDDRMNWRLPADREGKSISDNPLRIYAVAKQDGVRNTTLNLADYFVDTSYRYLRLTISNKNEASLKITGVSLLREHSLIPYVSEIKAALKQTDKDSEKKATAYIMDLGFANVPSIRMAVQTADENFNRLVRVYGSAHQKDWVYLGEDRIYRYLSDGNLIGEKMAVNYTEGQNRYIKVEIVNGDNEALKVDKIRLWGIPRKVLFRAEKGAIYTLYYGNPKAGRPEYDIDRLTSLIKTTIPYQPGKENRNSSYIPEQLPWTERNRWVLTLALVMLVGALGAIALRMFKKVEDKEV